MKESKFSEVVFQLYNTTFPSNWIENLEWVNDSKRNAIVMQEGISKINSFTNQLFLNYAKLVLSGDQFIHKTEYVGKISETLISDILDDHGTEEKNKLYMKFSDMQEDVRDAEQLVKYHCVITREQFQKTSKDAVVEAVTYHSDRIRRNELISLLEDICEICWTEYQFSYGEHYISHLLYLRENLKRYKRNYSVLAGDVIEASIEKIEILLAKLSAYSENKKIVASFDFNLETFEIGDIDKYSDSDFRRLFQEYLSPQMIESNSIENWQVDSHNSNVKMWQMAMLMRYYTKVTKSIEQINKLLKIEETQHADCMSRKEDNIVNKYAEKSFRNYMWNSRFSFMCQNYDKYNFENMSNDLRKIESIQKETNIYNYHPYEHALVFSIKLINKKIEEIASKSTLNDLLKFIINIYEKFKGNIEWCKRNQPYLMQMRYNFSSIKSPNRDFPVFCPSSFCRPLRFSVLEEHQAQYNNQISLIKYQVEHICERLELQNALKEISQMERKNIKYMGLYASVMTFLVGLLSIFIGNNGSVDIFTKTKYVSALGFILLIFTSAGYFAMSDKFGKIKPWIFGLILVGSLIILIKMSGTFL